MDSFLARLPKLTRGHRALQYTSTSTSQQHCVTPSATEQAPYMHTKPLATLVSTLLCWPDKPIHPAHSVGYNPPCMGGYALSDMLGGLLLALALATCWLLVHQVGQCALTAVHTIKVSGHEDARATVGALLAQALHLARIIHLHTATRQCQSFHTCNYTGLAAISGPAPARRDCNCSTKLHTADLNSQPTTGCESCKKLTACKQPDSRAVVVLCMQIRTSI